MENDREKKINEKKEQKLLSFNGAFVTFFKSLFGAGLLSLPNAIGRVGLLLGIAVYSLVGIGCVFSCYLLLKAKERVIQLNDRTDNGRQHNQRNHHEINSFNSQRYRNDNNKQKQHELITYGDLADLLLGSTMASVTRWTIIVLNILFTAGLAIVVCENMGELLRSYYDEVTAIDAKEQEDYYRKIAGMILLPIVIGLLQIPWLQDMWFLSAMGLAVYTVGVIGSTLYSAMSTIASSSLSSMEDDISSGTIIELAERRRIPNNIWYVNWNGISSFVGTAVYALEGINLALPTAYSMQKKSDATRVVCTGVLWYWFVTMVFAIVGYAGGLGGGPGTGLTPAQCDVVTNCITPPFLQFTIQITLSISMILSMPVMLYPSTEMLEVMLRDMRLNNDKKQLQHDNCINISEENNMLVSEGISLIDHTYQKTNKYDATDTDTTKRVENTYRKNTKAQKNPPLNDKILDRDSREIGKDNKTEEKTLSLSHKKSWKLRIFLAILTVMMGAETKSFTFYSEFIGAVGLSFAGFVLPPLLYLRSMERVKISISRPMQCAMALLTIFGLYNMFSGGLSSLIDLRHSFS